MYEFHDSEDSLFKHRTLICIAPSQNICPYSLRTPTYKLTFVGKEIHEKMNSFIVLIVILCSINSGTFEQKWNIAHVYAT